VKHPMAKYTMIAPASVWEPVSFGTTSFPIYEGRIWGVPREAIEGFAKGGFVLEGETPEGFEAPRRPTTWPAKGSVESKTR
jgi:hypothetical protein